MSIIQGNAHTSAGGGGYQIERSLRFNSADSAYLNRTPASAGNRKTWTWSGWVKRSKLGAQQGLIGCPVGTSDSTFMNLQFNPSDQLGLGLYTQYVLLTTQVFRDTSAWYHIVVSFDTTNAAANNRCRMYVNGVEITTFTTRNNPTQNADYGINAASQHDIGRSEYTNSTCLGGYLTEINFIDGQALTPSSFGETDSNIGVWKPKAYTSTYGTNGFYLKFADNSGTTSTTLGKDSSGNGNNWTPNNFSVTAGAGNDSMVDSPTSYGTDTGVGGEVRGNYSTLNALFVNNTYPITYSNGNLNATRAGGGQGGVTNTFGMASSKWYWEIVFTTLAYNFGITTNPAGSTLGSEGIAGYNGGGGTSIGLQPNGVLRTNGTTGSTYTSWTTNDVMGIALDMDGGNLYIYKNGTAMNSGNAVATSLTGSTWFFITSLESGAAFVANFGQRAFAYTAPSGFKALCTQNLPTPTIGATSTTQAGKYFNTKLWTGNGSTQSITGIGFQPDLVWTKDRGAAFDHTLFDAVRGATKFLRSNATTAEETRTDSLTSFDSDGFSVGADAVRNNINKSSASYVSWAWDANGAGSTNTAGTITSTVSANTTSGFSIVTYTGNGTNSSTVGHGLGVVPGFIVVKERSGGTYAWNAYHSALGAGKYLSLNTTNASTTDANVYPSVSSTTFGLTTGANLVVQNATGVTYVAYCFAPVAGYSAFGSYTGNGSTDGPFVFTNMRSRFLLVKRTDSADDWVMYDSARDTYNQVVLDIRANSSTAEASASSDAFDFLSNGFKLRGTTYNASGGTYIYMALAENPFKYSLGR